MPPIRALYFSPLLALLLAPASVGAVQAAPAPTPAPSGVAGPPDGLIAPPPPVTTRPLPAPQPFPLPTPAPVRPPVVRPSPPAQPQAERPVEATPRAPVPRAATPAAAPAPVLEEPPTPPVADPAPASSAPAPAAPVEVAPPPTAAPSPTPVPAADDAAPLVPLGLAALGIAIAGFFLWRRRKPPAAHRAPAVARAVPPPPRASPAPVATAPPPPAPTPLGRRAELGIAFEALSAQSTLLNLRIRYAVVIRNTGTIAAAPVTVRIGLFAGSHARPEGIAQWFAQSNEALHHAVDAIPAEGEYRFEGELAAPLNALNPITVDGRVLAVPLVAVDARYNHPAGEAPIDGQSARAFVIGRDSGRAGAKLAPFRLDQGPASFAPLGQRDTGISRVA